MYKVEKGEKELYAVTAITFLYERFTSPFGLLKEGFSGGQKRKPVIHISLRVGVRAFHTLVSVQWKYNLPICYG